MINEETLIDYLNGKLNSISKNSKLFYGDPIEFTIQEIIYEDILRMIKSLQEE